MRYFVDLCGEEIELELATDGDDGYLVTRHSPTGPGGRRRARIVESAHDILSVEIDGRIVELRFGRDGEPPRVLNVAASAASERDRAAQTAGLRTSEGSAELRAPMPGRILRVHCAPGIALKKGDTLLVIEAMKMENELVARADGTVTEVCVAAGDAVERDALLVRFGS
ncbi:MAG TPA: biotin/lipoyl-containing protein [Polyangiaceae bacterium]|jgi:biotin carboxyl carrier protein